MDNSKILEIVLTALWWLVSYCYYTVELLVLLVLPRSYRRKDVQGSVALVTGGGSGIGRLMCLNLVAKGCIVVTWDVSEEGNNETARQVKAAGGRCHTYIVDLCDRHAVYAAAAKVKEEVGKVDILINNAGIVTGKNLMESPDESIIKTFEVNAISHFWTTKAFLPDMMAKNKGHIVTIASMAGKMSNAGLVDYCASKHAAVGFHEALQAELKGLGMNGVKMTVVCPMVISTGMFSGAKVKGFPVLSPNYVADEVVDAMLMNVRTLYLPHYMYFVLLDLMLMPPKAVDHLAEIFDSKDMMKDFVGKKKDH